MSLEWVLFGLRAAAAALLYTFLGIAFYILWRDLQQAAGKANESDAPAFQLRVVQAGDDHVGRSFRLQPVTLIGRAVRNTIVLNRPTVSARHARLQYKDGVWWLEDLSSRNGTLLNDLPVSKPTPLAEGDVIGIGDVRFRLESAVCVQSATGEKV